MILALTITNYTWQVCMLCYVYVILCMFMPLKCFLAIKVRSVVSLTVSLRKSLLFVLRENFMEAPVIFCMINNISIRNSNMLLFDKTPHPAQFPRIVNFRSP